MFSDLVAKRLGLLHELVPKAALIGALVNPDYSDTSPILTLNYHSRSDAMSAAGES